MRNFVLLASAAGATCLAWASLAATGLDGKTASPSPQSMAMQQSSREETVPLNGDAQRRAELNARLVEMVRRNANRPKNVRQSVPPTRSRSEAAGQRSVARPTSTSSETHGDKVAIPVSAPVSTIAPPAYRGAAAERGFLRGRYQPPVLDLVNKPIVPTNAIECLTQALYYEARNESSEGQAAVAEVVLNRARSGRYPRDICEVVYQRNSRTCQFTFTCDGSIGRRPVDMAKWARSEYIAREVYSGRSNLLPQSSVNYHANYVRPAWGGRLERVRQIGAHIFYGAPLGGAPEKFPRVQASDHENRGRGLVFVRNEAIENAYQAMVGAKQADTDGY